MVDIVFNLQREGVDINYQNVKDNLDQLDIGLEIGPFQKIMVAFEKTKIFKE